MRSLLMESMECSINDIGAEMEVNPDEGEVWCLLLLLCLYLASTSVVFDHVLVTLLPESVCKVTHGAGYPLFPTIYSWQYCYNTTLESVNYR